MNSKQWMKNSRALALCSFACAKVIACGPTASSGDDAAFDRAPVSDSAADARPTEDTSNSPSEDASTGDAGIDVPSSTSMDASVDAGVDARTDAQAVRPDVPAYDAPSGDGSSVAAPRWWASVPVGEWYEVPNTRITATRSTAGPLSAGIFHDYSGVAVKRDDSTLIAFGGGHGGSGDNTVATLRLADETPGWVVWVEPTPVAERIQARSGEPMPPLWWGPSGNQRPNPWHTYSSIQFAAGVNRVLWYGCFGPWNYSGTPPGSQQLYSVLWTERRWAQPNTPEEMPRPMYIGRVTTQDDTGLIYLAIGDTIQSHNPTTNTWTRVANSPSLHWAGYGALSFDLRRRRLFRFGDAYSGASGNPRSIELGGSVSTPTFTGDATTIAAMVTHAGQDTLGMTYDPINDRYVLPLGTGAAFYAIDAGTWAVSVVTPRGAVPASKPSGSGGIYARIHYLPQLRALVYLPNAGANTYVLRL